MQFSPKIAVHIEWILSLELKKKTWAKAQAQDYARTALLE